MNDFPIDHRIAPSRVRRESGDSLDAHFSVRPEAGNLAVYLESRGGRAGSPGSRNPDYNEALWYILSRLAAVDAVLLDATIESAETANLPHSAKVLPVGSPYPLQMAGEDARDLRSRLQRAQPAIGRSVGAGRGGNNTRRLRLLVEGHRRTPVGLHAVLAGDSTDAVLEAVHAVEVVAGRRPGQGFATDARSRKAIEDQAMTLVRGALIAEGWNASEIEDVSRHESYDFLCRRRNEERRVEVKGSSGGHGAIIVTRLEVEHAKRRGDVWLAIVTDIVVERKADMSATARGGALTWHRPWNVDDGELIPLGYTWRVAAIRVVTKGEAPSADRDAQR